MITDNRPLSSPDASSRAPILLRRTLDSSFCSKALVGIHVSQVDAWADAMYRVPTKAISDLATCLKCSGGIEYLLVGAIDRAPQFRTQSTASLQLFFPGGGSLAGFRSFGPVERAATAALADAVAIQRAAHDVVAHAGQVFHAPTANKHDRVFLQVMPLTGDVGRDFHAVAQTNAGNFTHCRVRLLGRHGTHLGADAAFLRGPAQLESLIFERIEGISQRGGLDL